MPVLQDRQGKYFEYRHVVSFGETNLLGNVYFANYVIWQGQCREIFLHQYAPEVLADLQAGLSLVTINVSCEYLSELFAFDQVVIHMRLGEMKQNRLVLTFDYWRDTGHEPDLIARGQQQIAAMRKDGEKLKPTLLPKPLLGALSALQVTVEHCAALYRS